jgi:hypothetical protein
MRQPDKMQLWALPNGIRCIAHVRHAERAYDLTVYFGNEILKWGRFTAREGAVKAAETWRREYGKTLGLA